MGELAVTREYVRYVLADGVGPVTFRRLLTAFGDLGALHSASAGMLERVNGVGPKTAGAIAAVTDEAVDEEFALAAEKGVSVLTELDASFPPGLQALDDRPPVLYVRGELRPTDAVAVAVVGARRCTHYGLEQAERFGQLLARAGFTVVSGGARGIDTAAHRGALAAGGRTIAVMGCGLADAYPPENAKLFDEIARDGRGALVAELPMRVGVQAGNFPMRNRIISGMSLGVLVVEAGRRSGALLTARRAIDQNREVMAVPGRVDSPLSGGTNELIRRSEAHLVQNLDDALEALGSVGEQMTAAEEPTPPAAPPGLDETEQRLYAALADGELGLDELVRRTGVPSGKAAAGMTMLLLKGAIAQRPGNVFARKKGR